MHRMSWVCVCWLVTLASVTEVSAQQFTGGIRGAVRDANGIIPGVTVTLTNEGTSISREAVTNEEGQYNFSAVTPGTYTLRAVLQGFKTFERKGIRIGTQQFITLDVLMEVGQITEEISVTADAPLVETSTASVGETLDRQVLDTLPSLARNAFTVAVTVPTFIPSGDPQFVRTQDQSNASLISLGGGGVRANNYLVDGVPITELTGRAVLNPTIEALEDVRVQVHTYDAEMGRTGGGVFNASAKSGTNEYHGAAFYQTRPVWGLAENFFNAKRGLSKEESGLANAYYHTYGGAFGGPVIRNRTFFWTATEGYRSHTTRSLQYLWPSLKQRTGDFSTSTIGGLPVRLFNPWCRSGVVNPRCPAEGTGSIATGGEFTNAIIPRNHPAASQVGFNVLGLWPTQTVQGEAMLANEDNLPNAITTASLVDVSDMWSLKMEHKFTDRWWLNGFYVYNKTDEPGSLHMPPEYAYLEGEYPARPTLKRRPHVLVFNNTYILSDTTILTARYGWTTWLDQTYRLSYGPGIGSLGFAPEFMNAIHPDGRDDFPNLYFDEVVGIGNTGGSEPRRWHGPYAINGALSKLQGNHTIKVGMDLRRLGITASTESNMSGEYYFSRAFSAKPGVAGSGHELASVLLGVPRTGSIPFNRGLQEWFVKYWGGYVQDDWRINPKLTVNYGVRFEHEDGLREIENRQTVGFDRNVVNPIDALVPKAGTLLQGRTLTGGLVYAAVNGAPEEQGDPAAVKLSPRIGLSWSPEEKTAVRGGYGLFYAPWQYSATQHGQVGFTRTTALSQSSDTTEMPLTTLDNPFPAGLQVPVGSSLGLLTGVGGDIEFIDQTKGAPRVHQYSVDVQREVGANMAVTIGYMGATGQDIGYGGTGNPAININQIDPAVARAQFPDGRGGWNAAALRQSIPNPFFGIPEAGELGTRPTILRGQLLRPFPQFGNINMLETTEGGRRQYHAVTLKLDKRMSQGWWAGRFHYTWSSTKDNQFAQGSTYATITSAPQNNYDLDAEYSASTFDAPHRLVLAPIVRLPGPGEDRRVARALLGGWTLSAIVELVSGPPLNPTLSASRSEANLGLLGGRQRPNLIGDPNTSGSDVDRVAAADHPAAVWFDAAAFENPGVGRFGTAPRTIGDARLQFRKNADVSVAKDIRFRGGQALQLRAEIFNVTNTPKFGGAANSPDLTSFGRVVLQRGFMRTVQLWLRYQF